MSCSNPKYQEVKKYFDEAETNIKVVELIRKGLRIPAINQLRYVAYHLTKATTTPNKEEEELELIEALEHARRARYDALEAGIHYFMEVFEAFQESFKNDVVVDLFPDYPKHITQINNVIRNVSEQKRRISNGNWPNVQNQFGELFSIYEEFVIMRPKINLQKKKEAKIKSYTIIGLFLALIAIVVAITS